MVSLDDVLLALVPEEVSLVDEVAFELVVFPEALEFPEELAFPEVELPEPLALVAGRV